MHHSDVDEDETHVRAYYQAGVERDRLDSALGVVEFERTKEIIERHVPTPPATVADIGGGPGRHAVWLAGLGYDVIHRDVVPLHVEQALEAANAARITVDAAVADARSLDISDESVDFVLLLGPLYHLTHRRDRIAALREARRVVRPGGTVFAAAISRWVPRLHGMVVLKVYEQLPQVNDLIEGVERSGRLPPLSEAGFAGFCHRPSQLRSEVRAAGLDVVDLVNVEGIAFALPDLDERLESDTGRAVVLDAARALERVPELLGMGPHLLITARRQD
jgi:ubiquinone/menaquinone biosynthesis C-methylase UbiE